jgi:protein-S-isoprenylcysteine O-methyltransferase Ste14
LCETDPATLRVGIVRAGFLFPLFWIAWAVSWVAAAAWSSPVVQRPPGSEIWPYRVMLTLGIVMIIGRTSDVLGVPRLWDVGRAGGAVLAILTLPGFAFAWWARIHLGRLWSGSVTRKEGHRIIDTGPYAIVRHPIYTGLIWSTLVSAVAAGTIVSLLGFGAMVLGFWLKARLEERFLVQQLGPQAYDAYCERVPMLVPGGFGRASK